MGLNLSFKSYEVSIPTKKIRLALVGFAIGLLIYFGQSNPPCVDRISYDRVDLNKNLSLDSLYIAVDSAMKSSILDSWQEFSIASETIDTVAEFRFDVNRNIQIIEQTTDGESHFSAIIYPHAYDHKKQYATIIWANGLNQSDPSVDLRNSTLRDFANRMNHHFILIPSFRGQALVSGTKRYCSDGFFGDAFDGATDDALRLLYFVKHEISGVDDKRISAVGVSRGGTVALLMACRDTTLLQVVSISGPTDFYSPEVYRRYGYQYKYQFLSRTRSIKDIRMKMLKSSPIHFIENYPKPILLVHGANDHIVPVSNVNAVVSKLKDRSNLTSIVTEGGHEFYDWKLIENWIIDHE